MPVNQRGVFLHFGDPALRHDNHVAGLDSDVLFKILTAEDSFEIDLFDVDLIAFSSTEQQHLRMLGALAETAGDRDRFAQFDVAAEFILARLLNFALREKERFLEILDLDAHNGIFQDSCVFGLD